MTATMLSRLGRRFAGLALVTTATLTATACGSMQAGAAAVVGERRISVADVQRATSDIDAYAKVQDPKSAVSQEKVLLFLILAPDLIDAAAQAGVAVSEDSARQELGKSGITKPSRGAVDAVRSLAALNSMKQANKEQALNAFITKLQSQKIEVNPRYGKFDPTAVTIVAQTPDWLVGAPTPTPTLGGDGGGPGGGPGNGDGQPPAPAPAP